MTVAARLVCVHPESIVINMSALQAQALELELAQVLELVQAPALEPAPAQASEQAQEVAVEEVVLG